MRPLSDTISRLSRMRKQASSVDRIFTDRLFELRDFGSDPGALRGWLHVPKGLQKHAPLVVVLHGCTQTAASYDQGAGWSQMADRLGFAVLFPEQKRANNPNLCFNWFNPGDTRRGFGEALSIRQMIETAQRSLGTDPAKVFVTGLSAGGAMANVMLATYPEVFAGGAIIAGLPYGSANSVREAFDRMRGHGAPDEASLVGLARAASEHAGPWPRVSIWQGSSDATVHPANAAAIAAQWRGLHETGPPAVTQVRTGCRSTWRDASGREVVERFDIPGLGHGTPLKTSGEESCGSPGPFMLEAGISSTVEICRFWNLFDERRDVGAAAPHDPVEPAGEHLPAVRQPALQRLAPMAPAGPSQVSEIIEDALRKAGLMQ